MLDVYHGLSVDEIASAHQLLDRTLSRWDRAVLVGPEAGVMMLGNMLISDETVVGEDEVIAIDGVGSFTFGVF